MFASSCKRAPGKLVTTLSKLFTHIMPLSLNNIIWYRPNRQEGNSSIWEFRPSFYIPTWAVFALTAGSGPWKRRWAPLASVMHRAVTAVRERRFTLLYLIWSIFKPKSTWMSPRSLASQAGNM